MAESLAPRCGRRHHHTAQHCGFFGGSGSILVIVLLCSKAVLVRGSVGVLTCPCCVVAILPHDAAAFACA
eukprot:g58994.t1